MDLLRAYTTDSRPFWSCPLCMYVCAAHTVSGKRTALVLDVRQKLGRSVWAGFSRGCLKSRTESKLLPSSPGSRRQHKCPVSALLSIWWQRDVIDFSPTVHSPLNNAPRSAGLEIIECPRRLSPSRIIWRATKSPPSADTLTRNQISFTVANHRQNRPRQWEIRENLRELLQVSTIKLPLPISRCYWK